MLRLRVDCAAELAEGWAPAVKDIGDVMGLAAQTTKSIDGQPALLEGSPKEVPEILS